LVSCFRSNGYEKQACTSVYFFSLECMKSDASHFPCHQESTLWWQITAALENISLISSVTDFAECRLFPQESLGVNLVWPQCVLGILLHPQLALWRWKTCTHPKILSQMSDCRGCWTPCQAEAEKNGTIALAVATKCYWCFCVMLSLAGSSLMTQRLVLTWESLNLHR
jgi:hypothetical protein